MKGELRETYRTWIEIDQNALHHNVEQFFRILKKKTRLMAVIKSNAYGHGLLEIAESIIKYSTYQERGWFGVDSIVEAIALRRAGIHIPTLVLGYTLPSRLGDAARYDIVVTAASVESLEAIAAINPRPTFHLKIDTGMHRQGFFPEDMEKVIGMLKKYQLQPDGCYTHFSAAKDPLYPTYTAMQFEQFSHVISVLKRNGYASMCLHAAASGGTLMAPQTHLDMVRIGIGIYGHWPSKELELRYGDVMRLKLVLTWKTIIAELKTISSGSFVGYDLTERVTRETRIAILPIGYWHGYDRGFSGIGEVLIRSQQAKILGRVSMDMVVIDVTDIPHVAVGDEVILVGGKSNQRINAAVLADKIQTTPYELLTRINPRIKRVVLR